MTDKKIKSILDKFAPEQRAFAEAVATDRAELKILREAVAAKQTEYNELWQVFVTILHVLKEEGMGELRLHPSQMLRFKEEYRVERWVDPVTQELCFKLKSFLDN